jgi:hypothetical protein
LYGKNLKDQKKNSEYPDYAEVNIIKMEGKWSDTKKKSIHKTTSSKTSSKFGLIINIIWAYQSGANLERL